MVDEVVREQFFEQREVTQLLDDPHTVQEVPLRELSLGEYARRSLRGHAETLDDNRPVPDLSTWTIERLEHYASTLDDSHELDRIRRTAQSCAYRSDESEGVRRRWAKLALAAIARLPGDSLWERARRLEFTQHR